MAKVDLELVKFVLQRNDIDTRTIAHILDEINQEVAVIQDQEAKPPPVKKQFVMLISDPEGKLEGVDLAGWVTQIPEEEAPQEAIHKIIRSAYAYNITPKGRRIPVRTIGEACEAVSARILKEEQVWVKTKEPVLVLRTDNKIPREEIDDGLG